MIIGFYGGSFDPPHVAHLLAAAWVLATTEVDRVLVAPTYKHPLEKRSRASFEHRMAMCELAMADLERVQVSRVEEELGGDSLTLRTLEELIRRHPQDSFRLILGSDLIDEVPRWHRYDEIVAKAQPIIVPRSGFCDGSAVALPAVSSTDVRTRIADGKAVDQLIPRSVAHYIDEHGLYRSSD